VIRSRSTPRDHGSWWFLFHGCQFITIALNLWGARQQESVIQFPRVADRRATEYAQDMASNTDQLPGNPSHDLDLVTVFQCAEGGIEEMEVLMVQQLLESNGIKTVLIGDSPLPNFAEEIRVAAEDAGRARGLIAEALAAGPAGAAEAEAEGDR